MENKVKVKVMEAQDAGLQADGMCMLQAKYSRSVAASVDDHLKQVQEVGPDDFINKFVVGYGHDSIADCGTTTVFVEGVSFACAKALQHHPLYNGQESSTRYLDFDNRMIVNPFGTKDMAGFQQDQMKLYRRVQDEVREKLFKKARDIYGEQTKVQERAINARVFDISRAFLPVGMTTNLSMTMNLRNFRDHLRVLMNAPFMEVRFVANKVWLALQERYPSSFSDKYLDRMNEHAEYYASLGQDMYAGGNCIFGHKPYFFHEWNGAYFTEAFKNRPQWAPIPLEVAKAATVRMVYTIDYGSYRDIQRHRNCIHQLLVPLAWAEFEPWYKDQISESLQGELEVMLARLRGYHDGQMYGKNDNLLLSPAAFQHYCFLGQVASGEIIMSLAEAIYIAELRSQKTVHPTLRTIAIQLGKYLKEDMGMEKDGFPLYIDEDDDIGVVEKRGTQTILEKGEE